MLEVRDVRPVRLQAEGLGERVVGVPCIGRCEQAPAAAVGRNAIGCGDALVGALAARFGPEASKRIGRTIGLVVVVFVVGMTVWGYLS